MHGPLIPAEQVDDFVISRARVFTTHVHSAVTQTALHGEDLPVLEWRLLYSIARFGSCHVGHITKHTSIDPAHGSRAAAALEQKGLISRVEDPNNKRRKLVSLTAKGIDTFERIWPKARAINKECTDRLTPDELTEFKRLLDIINGAIEPTKSQTERPQRQTKGEFAVHT